MTLVFGYLLEWSTLREVDSNQSPAEAFRLAFESLDAIRPRTQSAVLAKRWHAYLFESPKPLHGLDWESLYPDAPYTYTVYVRVSDKTGTIVIAGARYAVTDEIVRVFNSKLRPALHRKTLNVRGLSEHLLSPSGKRRFALTYLLADVPAFGSALTSVALQGDDIGAVEVSPPNDVELIARQIGVRRHGSRMECARFGALGAVQFRTDFLGQFEDFLTYAYSLNYIPD